LTLIFGKESNVSTSLPWWRDKSPAVLYYGIAVALVAATVAIDLEFDHLSGINPTVSLFLCTILFVSWACGTGPAALASVLTFSAFDYFFLQPTHSFVAQSKDIPRLALFAIAASFVVFLSATQRRTTASLRRLRADHETTVRELLAANEALRLEINERKRAEDERHRAEAELHLTVDTIPVLVARYGPDGFMEFRNQTWRNYTGLSQDNVEAHRWGAALHPDDLQMIEREWRAHLATGKPFEVEQRLRRADGEYRWHWVRRAPLQDQDGHVKNWYAVGFEIEDRKRAEDALRASEAQLARAQRELELTIDSIPVMVSTFDADGTRSFVNKTWQTYTGHGPQQATGKGLDTSIYYHPDDIERFDEAWREAQTKGTIMSVDVRTRRADGVYRWYTMRRAPLRDDNGKIAKWYSVGVDVEDQRVAENAVRESEAKLASAERELRLMIDSIPVMVLRHRADGTIDFVNQVGRDYSGRMTTKWAGRVSIITHPEDVPRLEAAWDVALVTGERFETELRLRRADGEYRWFITRRVPLRRNEEVIAWYAATYDIEDRKRAEVALRQSEAKLADAERELRLTLDSIPTLAWRAKADGFAEYLNRRWLDYTGFSMERALGSEWQSVIHPDDRAGLRTAWKKMLESGTPRDVEARMRRSDGAYRWFLFRTEALRDEAGIVIGWYGTNTDIEDRKQAENSLQRIEAYAAEAQKLSRTGSFAWDIATRHYFWSDQTYQILGFDPGVRPSINLVIQRTHPEDRFIIERELDRSAEGAPYHDFTVRLLMRDGQLKHIHFLAHRITYESGNQEIVGAVMDISDSKKSQEALDTAQAALAHASRVATLGEISATIAHEVNQPLAAIVANGQACLRFLRRESPDLNDVRGAVEWIVKDGNRAGEIIRRVRALLKKVDNEKEPLDLNEVVNEVAALLQREMNAKKVMLQLELAPSVPPAVADRVQLQQVIINLIMNGAEAMQEIRGRPRSLVVRSYEDEEDHIVLAVKDCGVGISPEISDHLFDAFFSTKPNGLGVGLSICRSIIQDHGGELWVTDNSDGPGAAFRFSLPVHRETLS
jgi:PAS domain S-box-containing protein